MRENVFTLYLFCICSVVIKEGVCVACRLLRALFLLKALELIIQQRCIVRTMQYLLSFYTVMCWLKGIFNKILAKFIKHTHMV